MKWQLSSLVLFGAIVAVYAKLPAFLSCDDYNPVPWWKRATRVCHTSNVLPHGCECFDISTSSEFRNSAFKLPKSPSDVGVKFLLYTRSNKDTATIIASNDDNSIINSHFDSSKKTVIITHGWRDEAPEAWSTAMKDELLKRDDMNVILTDWKNGADSTAYYPSVANTRVVGAVMGQLIHVLEHNHNVNVKNIHLIGHSLGAHVSGTAGREYSRLNNGHLIGRISGLDPAGPGFETSSENVRLDKTDADFVDVLHTDAESLILGGFGIEKTIGHVDFFPNGGKDQPGCPNESIGILSIVTHGLRIACDHMRVLDYYTLSINQCPYNPPSGINPSCRMGYLCSTDCRGSISPQTSQTC